MNEGLLSIISAVCGQLVKMCVTFETHGRFGSNFADLFILTFSSQCKMVMWLCRASFLFAGRGLLVKMLITLEPHHTF